VSCEAREEESLSLCKDYFVKTTAKRKGDSFVIASDIPLKRGITHHFYGQIYRCDPSTDTTSPPSRKKPKNQSIKFVSQSFQEKCDLFKDCTKIGNLRCDTRRDVNRCYTKIKNDLLGIGGNSFVVLNQQIRKGGEDDLTPGQYFIEGAAYSCPSE
jgi:hypothetical protein